VHWPPNNHDRLPQRQERHCVTHPPDHIRSRIEDVPLSTKKGRWATAKPSEKPPWWHSLVELVIQKGEPASTVGSILREPPAMQKLMSLPTQGAAAKRTHPATPLSWRPLSQTPNGAQWSPPFRHCQLSRVRTKMAAAIVGPHLVEDTRIESHKSE